MKKIFSELKSKCKTKPQMRAFNEIVKTFANPKFEITEPDYTYEMCESDDFEDLTKDTIHRINTVLSKYNSDEIVSVNEELIVGDVDFDEFNDYLEKLDKAKVGVYECDSAVGNLWMPAKLVNKYFKIIK